MKLSFMLAFLLFFANSIFAQTQKKNAEIVKTREDAIKLYKEKKYEEAKLLFSRVLKLSPNDTAALNKRGNCYSSMKQFDSAMLDFKHAIKVAPTYPSPYFNLAIVYINKEQYEQAIYFLSKYSILKPNDPDSWAEQGLLYRQLGKYDSSFMVLEKAYQLDDQNPEVIYYLSADYYEKKDLDKAAKLAQEGQLLSKPDDPIFYSLAGFIYARKKDFKKAYQQMNEATIRKPKDSQLESFKIRFKLLANTSLEKLVEKDDDFKFKEITNQNIKTLSQWVKDSSHIYFYPTLLEKFKKDAQSLGLDEFFMLYYGQSEQDSYSPYGSSLQDMLKDLYKDLDAKNYQQCVEKAEKIIEQNPLDFNTYYYNAIAHLELGNYEKYYENYFKFKAFTNSLLATGDGLSYETAFLVIFVKDEYSLLNYQGYKVTGQALQSNNGFSYDVMSVLEPKGDDDKTSEEEDEKANNTTEEKTEEKTKKIFFNIQKSFDSMSKIFQERIGDNDKDKKDKKNKKKKKDKNKGND